MADVMAKPSSPIRCASEEWLLTGSILGRGGFATVYEAESSRGEQVAIKVIDREHSSKDTVTRVELERQTLLLAQPHPHIVRLFASVQQVTRPPPKHAYSPEAHSHLLLCSGEHTDAGARGGARWRSARARPR